MGPLDPNLTLIASLARVRPSHVYHIWKCLELAPTSFDPEAFAKFGCLEVKHVAAIVSALSDQNMLPVAPEAAAKPIRAAKGTRMAPDWQMPAEWLAEARDKRFWSQPDTMDEAEQFIAYWQGSGQTKADWHATWRNWYLRSKRPNGQRSPQSIETNLGDLTSHYERQAALYDKLGRWQEAKEIRARIGA